jgi:xanthine/CO dehydrogenase XdhC/CoxF family maturation factor
MSAFPRPATSHAAVKPDPSPRELPRSRVDILKEEVKAARRRVALSMRELRRASVREQGIRDGEVGRAVWRLIEQAQLEGRVIDQIRAELRGHLTPAQKAAFLGTIFEL